MKAWHLLLFIIGGIMFMGAASTAFKGIPEECFWIAIAVTLLIWVDLTK